MSRIGQNRQVGTGRNFKVKVQIVGFFLNVGQTKHILYNLKEAKKSLIMSYNYPVKDVKIGS